MSFKLSLKDSGTFYLATRTVSASESAGIKLNFHGEQHVLNDKSFKWEKFGPFNLDKGVHTINLENLGGFQAVNIISLIPTQQYNVADQKSKLLMDKFHVIDDPKNLKVSEKFKEVSFSEKDPTSYEIDLDNPGWLVFSDHYSANWQFQGASTNQAIPLYSMINGFYVAKNGHYKLTYKPLETVNTGIKISLTSLAILIFILAVRVRKRLL
jgi:hypothetical protein